MHPRPGTVRWASQVAMGHPQRGASWEASAFDARTGRSCAHLFQTFAAAAKSWRADALVAIRKGSLKQSPRVTVHRLLNPALLGRHARRNHPDEAMSTGRRHHRADRTVDPPARPACACQHARRPARCSHAPRVRRPVARHRPLAPICTVLSVMQPLRLILRRAVLEGQLASNPSRELGLPGGKRREDVVTDPAHAQRLLGALEPPERVIYATAFYAGLRRGELRALRWRHVDLASGTIRVEESVSQDVTEPGPVKTDAGRRTVPIIAALRDILFEHRMDETVHPDAFVFGGGDRPFASTTVRKRAARAWKAAGLKPTQLHAARHTFASLLIAAGLDLKSITTYLGHSTVATKTAILHGLAEGLPRRCGGPRGCPARSLGQRRCATNAPVRPGNHRLQPDPVRFRLEL